MFVAGVPPFASKTTSYLFGIQYVISRELVVGQLSGKALDVATPSHPVEPFTTNTVVPFAMPLNTAVSYRGAFPTK